MGACTHTHTHTHMHTHTHTTHTADVEDEEESAMATAEEQKESELQVFVFTSVDAFAVCYWYSAILAHSHHITYLTMVWEETYFADCLYIGSEILSQKPII